MGEITQIIYKGKKFSILPLYHPSPASPYGHKRNLDITSKKANKIKQIIK
jgi:hypothetical protein